MLMSEKNPLPQPPATLGVEGALRVDVVPSPLLGSEGGIVRWWILHWRRILRWFGSMFGLITCGGSVEWDELAPVPPPEWRAAEVVVSDYFGSPFPAASLSRLVNPAPCSSRVSIKMSMEKQAKTEQKWVFHPKMASQTLNTKKRFQTTGRPQQLRDCCKSSLCKSCADCWRWI